MERPSVLLIGDSTAASLGAGLVQSLVRNPRAYLDVEASGACGIVRGGDLQDPVLDSALQITCPDLIWHRALGDVRRSSPDVVVILVSLADTWTRTWDHGTRWLRPTDPAYRARIAADYAAYVSALRAAGARCIAWVVPPVARLQQTGGAVRDEESFTDGSQAVVQGAIVRLHRAGLVDSMIDLRAWLASSGMAASTRPDGTHFAASAGAEIGDRWLWDEVQRVRQGCSASP